MCSRGLGTILLLWICACGGSENPTGAGGDSPSVVGTYQLRSVNDGGLPALFIEESELIVEVTQGMPVLRADHSFVHTVGLRVTEGGQVSTQSGVRTGEWEPSRDNLFLVPDGGGCSDLVAILVDRLVLDDCQTGNWLEYVR